MDDMRVFPDAVYTLAYHARQVGFHAANGPLDAIAHHARRAARAEHEILDSSLELLRACQDAWKTITHFEGQEPTAEAQLERLEDVLINAIANATTPPKDPILPTNFVWWTSPADCRRILTFYDLYAMPLANQLDERLKWHPSDPRIINLGPVHFEEKWPDNYITRYIVENDCVGIGILAEHVDIMASYPGFITGRSPDGVYWRGKMYRREKGEENG